MAIKGKDIAEKAGVSRAAVSLALNNKPGISDETREKIIKIATNLGYPLRAINQENRNGPEAKTILLLICWRNEKIGESGVTPQVFPEISRGFYSELIQKLETKVNDIGYHLWLKTINADKDLAIKLTEIFSEPRISGVLLIATGIPEEDVALINQYNKEIIVVDTLITHLDLDCVVMDNTQGAYLAGDYLCKLGHRDIMYIKSANRINNFIMREKGFFAALKKNGVNFQEDNIISVIPDIETTFNNIDGAFRKKGKLPTAIFAENDHMAIKSIKKLINMGIKVPDQISVIGFDNIEAASLIIPGLTTIDVSKQKIADLAVDRLMQKIHSKTVERIKQLVTVKLIERQTCKPINH